MEWLNVFNFIVVILMLIPNTIYAYKNKGLKNNCTNKLMNIVEQIGRYGSMFLMVFNINIAEMGFTSDSSFTIWLVCTGALLLFYWFFWVLYSTKYRFTLAISLAIIPSIIFIFTGIMSRHWLLVIFGITFSMGHLYVTYQNNKITAK